MYRSPMVVAVPGLAPADGVDAQGDAIPCDVGLCVAGPTGDKGSCSMERPVTTPTPQAIQGALCTTMLAVTGITNKTCAP